MITDKNGGLRQSIERGTQCLISLLSPDHQMMPIGGYEVAHDVGRWWDAMLRAEHAIGITIPSSIEDAMFTNLKLLTTNSDGLLMNAATVPWLAEKAHANLHNFREAFLAFSARIQYRNCTWSADAGMRLLRTLERCLQDDGRIDPTQLHWWSETHGQGQVRHTSQTTDGWCDCTGNTGRALEAILLFYEATREPLALRIATRIAEREMRATVNADGTIPPQLLAPTHRGHDHSYLGTLRGLMAYGVLTNQHAYVDAIAETYGVSLPEHVISESGWAPHDLGKRQFDNEQGDPVADPASAGDVAQLALWLAVKTGRTALLDDTERILRARLLPMQINDDDAKCFPDNPLATTRIGAWGIHGPYTGKDCILDVLAAVVHSLCDVYQHCVTNDALGLRVNFHFSYTDDQVQVTSTRTDAAELSVHTQTSTGLSVRIPAWIPNDSLVIAINGIDVQDRQWIGNYVWFGPDLMSASGVNDVSIRYALPERITREQTCANNEYLFSWRGDEIRAVTPNPADFPVFPTLTTH